MTPVTRGLLVLLGQPGVPALSGLLGPRDLRETPVQQASRARLVTLEQLGQPAPQVLPARKGPKVRQGPTVRTEPPGPKAR